MAATHPDKERATTRLRSLRNVLAQRQTARPVLSQPAIRISALILATIAAVEQRPAAASLRPAALGAAILTVNSTLDWTDAIPGDGTCRDAVSGQCTLRAAVQEANATPDADTIIVPEGVYVFKNVSGLDDDATNGDLDLVGTVTIIGAGATKTVIDGNGPQSLDRVFDILTDADATIEGVTIHNGADVSQQRGAGARVEGTLTLRDVIIRDNRGDGSGGGISVMLGASLAAERVVIRNNESFRGAGLDNEGSVIMTNSVLADNVARGVAAGLRNIGTATLNGVTIAGNAAHFLGGGIYTEGTLSVTNSTMSGNAVRTVVDGGPVSDGPGGAIYVNKYGTLPSIVTLTNVTIADNTAASGAGGIYAAEAAEVRVQNILIAGSSVANCSRQLLSLGHNLESGDSCGFTTSGDRINTDPKLGSLQDNGGPTWTRALLAGSPAIDAGTSGGCPSTDQRGAYRPKDGNGNGTAICDIGAYEVDMRLRPGIIDVYLPLVMR